MIKFIDNTKKFNKDYNQQNATHPCAYGVAVRGFEDSCINCKVNYYTYHAKIGWLVVLRIYVVLAEFQPYCILEAGDN